MQRQSQLISQVRARALRTAMTDAERHLWHRLRGERLGVKFRRQHPLGYYIADFACLDPKLIVEIDGSQHAEQQTHDGVRDAFFIAQGFSVLRFPADAPFLNLEGVLHTILVHLHGPQAPTSNFPQRGKTFNHFVSGE